MLQPIVLSLGAVLTSINLDVDLIQDIYHLASYRKDRKKKKQKKLKEAANRTKNGEAGNEKTNEKSEEGQKQKTTQNKDNTNWFKLLNKEARGRLPGNKIGDRTEWDLDKNWPDNKFEDVSFQNTGVYFDFGDDYNYEF